MSSACECSAVLEPDDVMLPLDPELDVIFLFSFFFPCVCKPRPQSALTTGRISTWKVQPCSFTAEQALNGSISAITGRWLFSSTVWVCKFKKASLFLKSRFNPRYGVCPKAVKFQQPDTSGCELLRVKSSPAATFCGGFDAALKPGQLC